MLQTYDLIPNNDLRQRLLFEYRGYLFLEVCQNVDICQIRKLLTLPSDIITNNTYSLASSFPVHFSVSPSLCTSSHNGKPVQQKQCNIPTEPFQSQHQETILPMPIQVNHDLLHFRHPFIGNTALHAACCAINSGEQNATRTFSFGPGSSTQFLTQQKTSSLFPILSNTADTTVNTANRLGVSDCNVEGQTPLYLAARYGYMEAVACLLRRGAEPNVADWHGFTPLHLVAKYGHSHIIQLLVQGFGADLNCATIPDGNTAASLASTEGVRRLIVDLSINPINSSLNSQKSPEKHTNDPPPRSIHLF
ncbi:unnamed protein product [Trichobilharzia regenti]|nr:unnamed protein product [Trichobilharzia regenti]